MQGKILNFNKNVDRYMQLSTKKAEQGDLTASLGFLFSALTSCEKDRYKIFEKIADTYGDMGLLSLANAYWFRYLEVCPEDKRTLAYEQLAINYFYADNFFASSYYFHLKLSTDGFISQENLDEEVLEFFNQSIDKKNAYHVAYPFDKADWSFTTKMAKRALASGDFVKAEKIYSKIPKECMTEEVSGEYAVTLFLNKKDKKMIEVCNESLRRNGENITAYCNLASLYYAKKDYEKSSYYYTQAINLNKGDIEDAYKLTTCAMEQGDHLTTNVCLQKILAERTYDVSMSYFYAVSQANLGNFADSARSFCEILRIYPQDVIVRFYAEYLSNLAENGNDYKNILPISYTKELPKEIAKSYRKKIRDLYNDPKKISSQLKKQEVKAVMEWGLVQDNLEYAKNVVFILTNCDTAWAEKLLLDSLMNVDVSGEVKRAIISMLVLMGHKEKLPVVANDFFVVVKPRKVVFENKLDGDIFMIAYATCLSRMAFWNIDAFDKVAFSMNKIYKKLGDTVVLTGITAEELGALCICISKIEHLDNPDYVCSFFDARVQIVKEHLELFKGDKK